MPASRRESPANDGRSGRSRRGGVFVVALGVLLAELCGLGWALLPAVPRWNEQPANLGPIIISGFVLALVAAVSLAAGLVGSLAGYGAARLAIAVRIPPVPILVVVGGLVGWGVARFLVFDLGSTPQEATWLPLPPTVTAAVVLGIVWQLCTPSDRRRSGSSEA